MEKDFGTLINIKEYFQKQLRKNKVLTEDNIKKIKFKSCYNRKYKIDDIILYFMVEEKDEKEETNVLIKTISDKEFRKLNNDYEYLYNHNNLPTFRRKV